ncbi:hypothetical protein NDU88_001370 [Pleurodeles waltl]|uniref:Uncharacterized protein n=1 Tax=Pleurodeles waltl TaxID=8319 RepID=A0AAV7L9D2_PLEWA|nr:hypothetical protein NDU88_001370 [Pleurodeles waltl]
MSACEVRRWAPNRSKMPGGANNDLTVTGRTLAGHCDRSRDPVGIRDQGELLQVTRSNVAPVGLFPNETAAQRFSLGRDWPPGKVADGIAILLRAPRQSSPLSPGLLGMVAETLGGRWNPPRRLRLDRARGAHLSGGHLSRWPDRLSCRF